MYPIINLVSVIARQFFLPNPYVNIIKNQTYADLMNIFIGGAILHFLSFNLVGTLYRKGIDSPSSGSFLYLIFYILMILLITYTAHFICNIKVAIIVILSIYFSLFFILKHISNKKYGIQF